MYSIGDVARLAGVSRRVLRHYDDIGLLVPADVGANGYRRYAPAQMSRVHRILALKELGFSLEQVARLVDEDISTDELRGMLRLRQTELAAELATAERHLERVGRHIDRLESIAHPPGGPFVPIATITTRDIDPIRTVALTALSPTFYPNDIGPALAPLYPRLFELLAAAGVSASDVPIAYYEDHADGDGIVVHAAVPVGPDIDQVDQAMLVDLPRLEQAVCARHLGSMASVEATVVAMFDWIADHGLRTTGYSREVYLACPHDLDDWVTEIQFPVTRA